MRGILVQNKRNCASYVHLVVQIGFRYETSC